MANSHLYQKKLKRLLMEPETTLGTWEPFDANTPIIPAYDISLARDRGTRVIDRAGVMDGFAGAMCGVPGAFGSTLTFTTELHDVDGDADPYWVKLLYGSGHEGLTSGSTVTIVPSTKKISNYSAGTPCGISFGLVQLIDGVDDYVQTMTGSTGVMELALAAGERAAMNYTFVGTNDGGFLDVTQASWSASGSLETGVACSPFVVKGLTITLTDNTSTSSLTPVNLSTLTLTSNAETPDVLDPTRTDGFDISPVLFNSAPSVSFTIGATGETNDYFWQRLADGGTFEIVATMTSAGTGNTIVLTIPKLQYTDVSFGENAGYETYEITANCVRDPGSSGPPYSIAWTFS
jgi:hypothetical protein